MIKAILILIMFYIFYRLMTSLIIPKITNYRIKKYREEFKLPSEKLGENEKEIK